MEILNALGGRKCRGDDGRDVRRAFVQIDTEEQRQKCAECQFHSVQFDAGRDRSQTQAIAQVHIHRRQRSRTAR